MENIKRKLVEMSVLIEQKGFVNAWEGNISIVDRENDLLYITPTGQRKLHLKEEDISVLRLSDEEHLEGKPASSEYRLHKQALLARKDCTCVIHSHAPFLTAFAFMNKEVFIDCSVSFLYDITVPCLPYGKPGTNDIANGIAELLKDHNLITIANHGILAIDEDIETCFAHLECIENVVKGWYIAKQIGKPARIPDYDELVEEVLSQEGRVQL